MENEPWNKNKVWYTGNIEFYFFENADAHILLTFKFDELPDLGRITELLAENISKYTPMVSLPMWKAVLKKNKIPHKASVKGSGYKPWKYFIKCGVYLYQKLYNWLGYEEYKERFGIKSEVPNE